VLDHAAAAGAPADVTETCIASTRGRAARGRGCRLPVRSESTILANPKDPHTVKVFDPSIRARPISSSINSASRSTDRRGACAPVPAYNDRHASAQQHRRPAGAGAAAHPRSVFDYADRGSFDELTIARNRSDLQALQFRQRVMRDLRPLTLATTMLGEPVTMPLGVAPVGSCGLFHGNGEIHGARRRRLSAYPSV